MKTLTRDGMWSVLDSLGVKKEDTLFVHADLTALGELDGGVEMVADTMSWACRCLVVPTFNFQYCDSRVFNVLETPSMLGVLSEYVRKNGRRSHHPTESVAAWGNGQVGITRNNPYCAYDPLGAFDELYHEDAKLLMFGVKDYNETMIHFAEVIAGVPYRYWKNFPGRVYFPGGWRDTDCKRYVRDMDINVTLSSVPIAAKMESLDLLTHAPLNYGEATICRVKDWVDVAVDMIEKDGNALVVKA
jgi:aminoglycoside 3-N-acetyltransferase